MERIDSRGGIITKACLWLALAGAGFAQEQAPFVLVTVDTLRADHVAAFNESSPAETPSMDRLASDGVVYLRAHTTNPLTFPAHSSLMTGQWPPAHGVRDFTGYRLGGEATTLAEALAQLGYRTAAFVSAAVLDHRTGLARGFDVYDDGFESFLGRDARVAERPGRETLGRALEWLEEQSAQEPFFLWLHLFEPHDPYEPPEPYRSRHPKNPYAGEVAYADALVGELMAALTKKELYEPSLISLLSDHGEGLGEHGESKHGFFIYQSTMLIPWIVKFPGNAHAGRRAGTPASIVDAFPTFLHALGVERRHWPRTLQGRSRIRAAMGESSGRSQPVYLESLTPRNQFGWSDLRGLVTGRFKLIEAPRPELYDLKEDPGETRNLFDSESALGGRLQASLREFEARFQPRDAEEFVVDAELQEQLRSIGYVGSPAAAARSESREGLADPKDRIETYEKMQSGVEAARQRRWGEAIRQLEAAAQTAPGSPAILSSLALTCRDAQRPEQALKWFQKALDAVPDDTYLRLQYAEYLVKLGRAPGSKEQFERILKQDPQHFLAHFNLGVHHGREGDFQKAASHFGSALEIREDAEAARMLGLSYLRLRRVQAAEGALQKALELDPKSPAVHANLATLYQALGQADKAREHQRKARELARRP